MKVGMYNGFRVYCNSKKEEKNLKKTLKLARYTKVFDENNMYVQAISKYISKLLVEGKITLRKGSL